MSATARAPAAFCSASKKLTPLSCMELAHQREDLFNDFRSETHRRLIEQYERGAADERSSDGKHLLLAARQMTRRDVPPVAELGEAHVRALDGFAELEPRRPARVGACCEVFLHGEVRKAVTPLEHLYEPVARQSCAGTGARRDVFRLTATVPPPSTSPRSAARRPDAALRVVLLPAPFGPSKRDDRCAGEPRA
jgi:hypothetical protein